MHWTSWASLCGGWLVALPIGALVSECSSGPSEMRGTRLATHSQEVLSTQSAASGTVATLTRYVIAKEGGGHPQPQTGLQWQHAPTAPWLRLQWPGHPEDAQMKLQEDGSVIAHLDGLQVRIHPRPADNTE